MADLKAGTTVGGAGIWNASNFQITPAGDFLTYRGYKVYTSNDKPSAEDIGALSLNNGGSIKGPVTTNNTFISSSVITGSQIISTFRSGVVRSGGSPYFHIINTDLISQTTLPGVNTSIGNINFKEGSTTSDPWQGAIRSNISSTITTTGDNLMYIDNRDINGTVINRITMNSATATTQFDRDVKVVGTTTLATLAGTTATFSGPVSAASLNPTSWTNIDARFMKSYTKRIPVGITSLSDSSITETNDVWTVTDNFTDGPNGNATYAAILVNYRRADSTGAALVQRMFTQDTTYIRTANGSPGAWIWRGGDTNGWRKVFDSSNLPTTTDINALPLTGGTLTGLLNMVRNGSSAITVSNSAVNTANALPAGNAYLGALNFRETSPTGLVRGQIETLVNSSGDSILQTYIRGMDGTNKIITQLNSQSGFFDITLGSLKVSNGNLEVNGGSMSVRASTSANNANLYFRNTDNSERALIWASNDNNLYLRSTGGYINVSNNTINSVNLLSAAVVVTGGITKYTNGQITGLNNAKLFADHGNGNVTLSASLNPASTASGTLFIGYDARGSGFYTDTVSIERPVIAKYNINAAGRVQGSDILSATQVYSGGGAAYLHVDGNIYGPAWQGGALSVHIENRLRATQTQGIYDIGSYMMARWIGGENLGQGTFANGSGLRPSTADGSSDDTTALPGSWVLCGRAITTNDAHRTCIWRRVG